MVQVRPGANLVEGVVQNLERDLKAHQEGAHLGGETPFRDHVPWIFHVGGLDVDVVGSPIVAGVKR